MKTFKLFSVSLLAMLAFVACSNASKPAEKMATESEITPEQEVDLSGMHKAYFASGCFWCVEAVFESVEGVAEAVSGYSGGESKNPTYGQISSGSTRHAEAVEVYYDSSVVDYPTLLKVFFGSQDPTTPNQQGPDRGPQYRSMVFYQTAAEQRLTNEYIAELENNKVFDAQIVTEVEPLKVFWPAEDYHQNYERNHPNEPYVKGVSIPRLKKFQKKFPELLKAEAKH